MKSVKNDNFAPKAKRIALGVISISALAVFGDLAASIYFTPEKIVKREMERIAKDYYENYFYDNYTANLTDENREKEIKKFEKKGFPKAMLRQLLRYDDNKHIDSAKNFKYEGYTCDTNKTSATFYPEPPYGNTDYRVEYHYDCK